MTLDSRTLTRTAVVTVVTLLAGIAVGAFALAFGGQMSYMTDVAGYPPDMAWVGPAVVEGTLAMTLLAGLVLTLKPWTMSWAWTWGAMSLASAGSVTGNVIVASHRGLSPAGVVTHGSWSVWVIVSEVVAVIVVRQAWPRTARTATLTLETAEPMFTPPAVNIEVPFGPATEPLWTPPAPVVTEIPAVRVKLHQVPPLSSEAPPPAQRDRGGVEATVQAAAASGKTLTPADIDGIGKRYGYSSRQVRRIIDSGKAQARS